MLGLGLGDLCLLHRSSLGLGLGLRLGLGVLCLLPWSLLGLGLRLGLCDLCLLPRSSLGLGLLDQVTGRAENLLGSFWRSWTWW